MIFFLLTFVVIDYSWLMFSQMNMQDAVREAGRYASTGNHVPDPSGGYYSRVASITQVFDSNAVPGVYRNCNIAVSSATGGAGSAGGPGDTVTITATCAIPLLTPGIQWFSKNYKFNFVASSSFVNEPFPPAETS
jgi:Flp pilus assembly protein TadG